MKLWPTWRRGPDFKSEIPQVVAKIESVSGKLRYYNAAERHWPARIWLAALGVALLHITWLVAQRTLGFGYDGIRFRDVIALILAPTATWGFVFVVRRGLRWRTSRLNSQLKVLVDRRKKLVEEYKRKTNFDEIIKLVDPNFDAKLAEATSVDPRGKPARGAGSKQPQSPANSAARQGQQTPPSFANNNQPPGANSASSPSVQPGANGATAAGSSPAPPTAVPTAPYRRTWVDRILDVIIGENEQSPANRYALICPICHTHNGLAPYGMQAEDVVYRCSVCGHLNGDNAENVLAKSVDAAATISALQDEEAASISKDPAGKDEKTQSEPALDDHILVSTTPTNSGETGHTDTAGTTFLPTSNEQNNEDKTPI